MPVQNFEASNPRRSDLRTIHPTSNPAVLTPKSTRDPPPTSYLKRVSDARSSKRIGAPRRFRVGLPLIGQIYAQNVIPTTL